MNIHNFVRWVYHKFRLEKPYAFVRFFFTPMGHLRNFVLFPIGAFLRTHGYCSDKDRRILQLKDKHKGERVFVVCSGPSLTESDVKLVKDEYTIGMNSIFKIYDKTGWKPSYYLFLEVEGFRKYMNNLDLDLGNMAEECSIINSLCHKYASNSKILTLHYNWLDHWVFFGSSRFKYSSDLLYGMYDFYSSGHAAILLAIYMGFKDIYLLGADNNYLGEKMYFERSDCSEIDDAPISSKDDKRYKTAVKMQKLMNLAYEEIAKIGKKESVNIYNATRGGCVEAFPRVKLEDVLKDNKS